LQGRAPFFFQRAQGLAVCGVVRPVLVKLPEIVEPVALDEKADERAREEVRALLVQDRAERLRCPDAVEPLEGFDAGQPAARAVVERAAEIGKRAISRQFLTASPGRRAGRPATNQPIALGRDSLRDFDRRAFSSE